MDQALEAHEQVLIRAALASPFMKQLLVASAIAEGLAERGWDPLLIGDTAVSIHTQGGYLGKDLTMVLGSHPDVDEVMTRLGFQRKPNRWFHPDLNLFVPDQPSEIDLQARIHEVLVEDSPVLVIAPEDAVIERLVLLRDTQDVKHGLTALLIALSNELDAEYLMLQAYRAGIFEGLIGFRELVAGFERGEAPKRLDLELRLRDLF
ncbi:MAG TPA: hypothetical protein V6D05_01905 [Stenomitos sp.]